MLNYLLSFVALSSGNLTLEIHGKSFFAAVLVRPRRFFYFRFFPTSIRTQTDKGLNRIFQFFIYMGYKSASNVLTATTCDLPAKHESAEYSVAANASKGYAGKKRFGFEMAILLKKFCHRHLFKCF